MKLCREKAIEEDMLENILLFFIPRMCSYANNIGNVDLLNIYN